MTSKTMNSGAVKLLLVSGTMASVTSALLGAPQGEHVVRGNVQFNRSGDLTRIWASNGAIINYRQFNIARNETVQFIQPNSRSRVLNRVLDKDPTVIAGTLLGNGKVYIVNPAGVSIRNGALIDVAGMYAAAGNISDDDFARGINRFTGLTGNVTNEGTINGAEVILAGAGVTNAGTINSPGGYVAMAAGNDVLIGESGGTMFVRVQGAAPGAKAGAGIENTGNINAAGGTYAAATGDMFAMAIMQGGNTTAKNVNIQGGNNTQTVVTGTIDASGKSNGAATGGNVTVVSNQVALMDTAVVDASGPDGGGTVQIGGGYQGQGTPTTAMTATVLDGAIINADATENGNGGQIIVWSEWYTGFGGSASVRGAGDGNGGLIETSSRLTLDVAGTSKIFASGAGAGKAGTWLLDPQDMIVSNAPNTFITALPLVNPNNAANPGNVNADAIRNALNGPVDGVADGADVVITTALLAGTASGDLTWTANAVWTLDAAEPDNRSLTLRANRNITFAAGSLLSTTSNPLDLFLQAGSGLNAAGAPVDPGDSSNTTLIAGGITLLGGGAIVGTGNNFTLTNSGAMLVVGSDVMSLLYTGSLNIAGQLITFDGLMTLGANASAINVFGTALVRNGFIAQGDGGITFDGNTTLQGSPTIASNGGSIRFQDGTLTLNDNQIIDADDGAGGPTTTGEVHFHGSVNSQSGEANDLTVHAGADIHLFGSSIGGGIGSVNQLGTVTFNLEPGGAFRPETDGGTIGIFAGDITVNGTTVLDDTGEVHFHAEQTFLGATSTVTFNGDVQSTQGDETDLRVSAVAINFNGNLGQGGASNVVGDVILRDQTNANAAATLATVNSTAWNVRGIDAGTTVRVANGGLALDIASDNSLFRFELQSASSDTDLSFVGAGFNNNVDFRDDVGLASGGNVAFGSLRVAGTTDVEGGMSINTTNAGASSGDQDYEGAFLVDNSVSGTNATINATGGRVTFYSTVDDDNNAGGLFVNGREVRFQNLIGETNDELDRLVVNATELIVLELNVAGATSASTGILFQDQAHFTAPRIELANELEFQIESAGGGGSVQFNGNVQDTGNGTDAMYILTTSGTVLFNGNVGTGTDEAIGRLVVTASSTEFRSTVLSTDAGGFDGDQIYNTNVVLNSAGRTHRFAYIGNVYALGTSADLGATLATIDPTFGFGDISFRGTINSFDNGVSHINNGMLVETSGRREFQGSIGTGSTRSYLAFLTTGGDANVTAPDPAANPGIDLLGDTAQSPITIRSFANTDGTNTGNISFWGPTYLDNDVTFTLHRDGGLGGTDDIAGERELTFRRTLDSFDTTLRNLDVTTSFRTWFRDDVGEQNTSGGAVPDASRLSTADITAEDIFRGIINGGVPADAWIRLGSEDDGGGNWFDFKTNSPSVADQIAQRFNGPVRLDAQVDVDDDNNGDIIFENIVDSFSSNLQTLEVKTGGRGWFRGNVGFDFNPLDRLITDSDDETEGVDGTYFGFNGNTIQVRAANTGTSAAFGAVSAAAIEINDDLFLDGDAVVRLQDAAGVNTGGGVNFHDDINSSIGFDPDLHGLTVFSSGTTMFFDDIGQQRALSHLITDVPGFSRFGNQNGGTGNTMLVTTNGNTTDIGDPVSLDADSVFTELDGDGVLRFRGAINSFNATFRALRLLTPEDINENSARTELWGNIGTGFIASGSGGDPDGSSGVPNDAVSRSLRFLQTDGFGITQLGNNSDNDAADIRNAQITIRTEGDPQTGDILSNNFNAIDMQDAVLLDASYTFDTRNARNLRFYETIDSVVRVGGANLTATNRSLTINNTSGNIAFDDNIGTLVGAFGNGRLLFILTDTDGAGNSGTIRLGNSSGLNGLANGFSNSAATSDPDGPAINIQTSGASGVQLGDQFIDLDADIEIDAAGGGTVNFGANALTGKVNSLNRTAFPGTNTDNNSVADGDDMFRGLTINTSGATRFFNTVGQQSFTGGASGAGRRRLAYIRTDYVLNSETGSVGSGTTRFDSDVFLQGRESAQSGPASSVFGQQRRIALTINDQTIIGDNTEIGTTVNGVTFDSLISGNIVTGTGGGALRFRGNVTTDGTQRDLFLFTNAQTFTRSLYFSFSQSERNSWAANMLAPVAFGGDIGSSGGRFQSVTINQPDSSPFGVRGTGLLADNGDVPVVSTIFWADGGSAWGTDDAWSLDTGSVGALDSSLNTTTFDVWTTGRAASGGRIVGIDFGQSEKGTAFGNLELKSSTGQIFIGDLNAVGAKGRGATSGRLIVGEVGNSFDCTDDQKTIMVRTRTSGRTVRFFGSNLKTRSDQGTDFVANKIKFLSTPGLVAATTNVEGGVDKHRIQFSTPDGGHVTINGDSNPPWIVRRFGESLYERQFVNNFNDTVHLFDLPARGISQSEKATAWAKEGWNSAPHEVWPREMSLFDDFTDMEGTVGDPVLLNNAERKSLEGINVMTRTQTPAQMMDNLIGREFFNDRPNASDAASASDQARAVSLPRLNRKAATALAAEAQKILAGSGDTAKAMALIDQLGITPTEAAAMKASLQRRAGVPAK